MKKVLYSLSILLSFISTPPSAQAQDHGHLYVGATGTNQNDPLIIANAADFITTSGYVKTLSYTNGGRYAGYFEGNVTFEANPAYNALGDPVAGSAALGAWVHAQITSVDGPAGGVFSFWETGATNPTINIATGSTSTNIWHISNNNGAPGSDPFGHIHGRRFTVTKAGIYTVTFKATDRSSNGAGGGPIHNDSEALKVYFQAGFNLASVTKSGDVATARFGTLLNRTFYLEASSDLASTNWTTVGSTAGNDYFQTLNETNATSPRFYRVRVTTP